MLSRLAAALLIAALAVSTGISGEGPGEFKLLADKKGPKALEVIEEPTLYRVVEMEGLPCSARTFAFLLDRPRTSMVLARVLDPALDEYEIEPGPDGGWRVEDHDNLTGDMELIEAAPGRRVYYITGHWRFVFGITFEGRMVLVPEYEEAASGGSVVNASARGYMKIDNAFAGFMARVVAFIFPGKVDARIKRFAGAVRKVAEAVRDDPEGMYRKLVDTGKVPPGEAREYRAMFLEGHAGG